jgi:molybdate transport system ATP-binding protein
MTVLALDIRHRLGELALDARFESEGPVTALFGPSGSGKTSLVNAIAGLIRPDSGRIALAGETFFEADTGRFVPAHRRRIGYVFQEARLFPHLTVRQNLGYGIWVSGVRRDGAEFDRVVSLLGLEALLARRPATLSGGERQRVAIGRALLARPRLLLMDEPLASLDGERKDEILSYIERIKATTKVPIVYVTHAMSEIIRLASHVAFVQGGKVTGFGRLEAMLAGVGGGFGEPSALLEGTITGFDPAFGLVHVNTAAGPIEIVRAGLTLGQHLRLRILASDVMLARRRPEQISAQNLLEGTVAAITPVPGSEGARVDVALRCGRATVIARITAKAVRQLELDIGTAAVAVIKSVAIEY